MTKWRRRYIRWRLRRAKRKELNRYLDLHYKWVMASIAFLGEHDPAAAIRLGENVKHHLEVSPDEMQALGDSVQIIVQEFGKHEWA